MEVLYDDRPFIVSGRKNPWAGRRKIDLAELVEEPWLLPLESIFSSVLAEAFQSRGLDVPKMGVRSYCVYQRLSLIATDRFVASVPGSESLRFNADQFSLKVLPVDFVTRLFQVAVVTLKNRTLSPVVHSFIDCVRKATRPLVRDNLQTLLLECGRLCGSICGSNRSGSGRLAGCHDRSSYNFARQRLLNWY